MGGVDLLDQYMAYYRIFIKSKKWNSRIIFHFVDLTISAAFIEYRQDCLKNNIPEKSILNLLNFRMTLGSTMTKINQKSFNDVRFDQVGHFSIHDDTSKSASRCKLENCGCRSRVQCEKCKVHLCLTSKNNCFKKFHTK
jgi:hypothetical protein